MNSGALGAPGGGAAVLDDVGFLGGEVGGEVVAAGAIRARHEIQGVGVGGGQDRRDAGGGRSTTCGSGGSTACGGRSGRTRSRRRWLCRRWRTEPGGCAAPAAKPPST